MIIKPCPNCGSDKIKIYNCGYTIFNCGYVKCLKCNFGSGGINGDVTVKDWNKLIKEYHLRKRFYGRMWGFKYTPVEWKLLGIVHFPKWLKSRRAKEKN